MGYSTNFFGKISIEPPLDKKEVEYINKFNHTRRMHRTNGPYFVESKGPFGQSHEDDIIDYNQPDPSQPSLWCQWEVSKDGKFIQWDGGEKFYCSVEWMEYLIEHFLSLNPKAEELNIFKGHVLNGSIEAQGEDAFDRWTMVVKDNEVFDIKI